MKNDKRKKEESGDKRETPVLLESMSQYVGSRSALLLSYWKGTLRRVNTMRRPWTFSREIISRHARMFSAHRPALLSSLLAESDIAEMRGFAGTLLYKDAGAHIQQFIYHTSVEAAISITLNKVVQL